MNDKMFNDPFLRKVSDALNFAGDIREYSNGKGYSFLTSRIMNYIGKVMGEVEMLVLKVRMGKESGDDLVKLGKVLKIFEEGRK